MFLTVSDHNFSEEVLDSSVPVLVSFWAPWCGLCRVIEPVLNRFRDDWQDQIKLVGVNADENLKLASTYRLTTLPTLIWFEEGQILHRFDSFHGRDDLRRTLETLMSRVLV